ncbi:MAG: RdgB/HAM1 family non-canonical purine NTP pyrophosphatase [Elusimicrobiales bacterium]
MSVKKIVFATKNNDKFREIKKFFSDIKDIEWLSFLDFSDFPNVVEDQPTIEANSRKKAVEISRFYGIAALADDTGLFVDFLDGKPGVFSARWAGEGSRYIDNNLKLLDKLKGVDFEKRTASFKCAVSFALPDGECITEVGEIRGYILNEMRGDGGFGYDPLFWVKEKNKTFAQMSIDEKNSISHRAKALLKIKPHILRFCEGL